MAPGAFPGSFPGRRRMVGAAWFRMIGRRELSSAAGIGDT
jgi:hypothetical protein